MFTVQSHPITMPFGFGSVCFIQLKVLFAAQTKKVTYLDALGNVIVKSTSRIDKMYMVGFCFMQANLFLYF
jgi:hypothetical protein